MTVQPTESILIVDFGSQVTQLIARRIREAGVYSEIAPFNAAEEAFERLQPKGIIFSGGPASVTAESSPRAPQVMFDSGLPLLGICYGQQTLHQQLGGQVVASDQREFGRAFIEVVAPSALFDGLWNVGDKHQVWMSHGDRVETLAPGFEVVARSEGAPFAIATDEKARRYSLMFHPEVVHTPDGGKLLANFVRHVCGCAGDWTMASFKEAKIADIREQVGDGRVICGLSGGVDSAVAAVLIHEISFLIEGAHAHDLATLLDHEGIAVRSGHHCAHPLMQFYGVPATCRASFAFYNTREEVDRFIEAIARVRKLLA